MSPQSDAPPSLSEADIIDLNARLGTLAPLFTKMQVLKPTDRQRMVKMGARSVGFCREMLSTATQF